MRIINEPTAALAYGLDKIKSKNCCLRFRVEVFDISVLELGRSFQNYCQQMEIHT
jgi:molecular chaperone DnaK (HSP70)